MNWHSRRAQGCAVRALHVHSNSCMALGLTRALRILLYMCNRCCMWHLCARSSSTSAHYSTSTQSLRKFGCLPCALLAQRPSTPSPLYRGPLAGILRLRYTCELRSILHIDFYHRQRCAPTSAFGAETAQHEARTGPTLAKLVESSSRSHSHTSPPHPQRQW